MKSIDNILNVTLVEKHRQYIKRYRTIYSLMLISNIYKPLPNQNDIYGNQITERLIQRRLANMLFDFIFNKLYFCRGKGNRM